MKKSSHRFFANSLDGFIPELWAETLLVELQENMVAANLVHRDFEPMFARKGDIVNANRPADFSANRKAKTSDIILQDATAETVPVKLNQQLNVAFAIHDADQSKAFADLIPIYIKPAARALASRIDRVVCGAAWRFRVNMGGTLAAAMSKASLLQAREKLVTNKAPETGRNCIVPPSMETTLLGLAEFSEVDKVGGTAALVEASLGRKFGLDIYCAQNAPTVLSGYTPAIVTGAINAGNLTAGSTVLTVDGFTGDVVPVGSYVTIAGDDRPRRVTAKTAAPNTTSITIATGIRAAILDNAVVTAYGATALVNLVAGYAAGYEETIAYDTAGTGKYPQVGQLCSFGTASDEYTIMKVTGTASGTIELDRPLDAALADNVAINLGPVGSYGFVFHKHALALVVRPMAIPRGGVLAATAMDERIGAALRVAIQYDITSQKTIVSVDLLCGITVLDEDLGVLLMSSDVASS